MRYSRKINEKSKFYPDWSVSCCAPVSMPATLTVSGVCVGELVCDIGTVEPPSTIGKICQAPVAVRAI